MRVGIGGKLLASLAAVLVGLAIVGFIGWQNTVRFSAGADDIYHDGVVMSIQLARVQRGLYELRLGGAGQSYATADAQKRAQIRQSDEKGSIPGSSSSGSFSFGSADRVALTGTSPTLERGSSGLSVFARRIGQSTD